MKIELSGYVVAVKRPWNKNVDFYFTVAGPQYLSEDEIVVCEQVITLNVPDDFDYDAIMAATKAERREKLIAEQKKQLEKYDKQWGIK